MKWWTLAKFKLEQLARFEGFVVEHDTDRQACVEIMERVRRDELRRLAGASSFENPAFDGETPAGILVAVRDLLSGHIVGCVRGIFAQGVVTQARTCAEYRLDLLAPSLIEHTGIAVAMVVLPEYRGGAASLVLTSALYRIGMRDHGMQVFLVSCEPALLSMYLRLGYRPLARVWAKHSGGFRVPVMLVGHDEAQLVRVRSPLLEELRKLPKPWPREALEWLAGVAGLLPVECGVHEWDLQCVEPALRELTRGLSEQGRRALLRHAVEVEAQPGDLAFRTDDGGRGLAVVLTGSVEVRRNGDPVARLGGGSVLGVATTALDQPRLADIVVVAADTRLLLLSRSAVDRVSEPEDRAVLWANLARLLAARFVPVAPPRARTLTLPGGR